MPETPATPPTRSIDSGADAAVRFDELRVLVIEDQAFIRQVIRKLLRQIGCTHVYEAEDGDTGFTQLLRVEPDLVLCDIAMEPVDGMAFVRRVRSSDALANPEVPIVFLTSDSKAETVREAVEVKVNGYLVKPVDREELRTRVAAVMARAQQGR